jgi:AmmeMemoRadiSam system protein B/AmmeMemoRadiSam system protein A
LNIDPKKVRAAGVAGQFYPANPAELVAMMDTMLAQAPSAQIAGAILGIIVPHAGYPYSGPVAARVYAALQGRVYKRVVVIAPSHYEAFDFTSVFDGDAYQTALGTILVDRAFAARLAGRDASIRLSASGHRPTSHGSEHALEVQLPWLQRILGDFALVPVVMGKQDYQSSRALGVVLAELLQAESADGETPGETLIVASSDLSHFHNYSEAVQLDHKTLSAFESWDYFSMSRNFHSRVWEACGGAPVVAAMIASERMGARQARVLHYANSGDAGGDHSRVVGYGAGVLVKAHADKQPQAPFSLTDLEKNVLLALARNSVEHALRTNDVLDPEVPQSAALRQERGAFVTLKIDGALRGCVGFASAVKPLFMTVRDTATLAALRDPRFPPVEESELSRLQYEISVLSPLRRAMNVSEIEVGRHGLLVKLGDREGLLLPQVPVEHHWDSMTFLQQTCGKAGLKPDAWRDPGIDIFLFTAVIFGETPQPKLEQII